MRKLSRTFSNLEQARQDVPGYYRTSAGNEKAKDEAAHRKFSIIKGITNVKDKLLRRSTKLKKASEKVASINPFIMELMDWLKATEQNLQKCVPKQLSSAAFMVALEQSKVRSVLYNTIDMYPPHVW